MEYKSKVKNKNGLCTSRFVHLDVKLTTATLPVKAELNLYNKSLITLLRGVSTAKEMCEISCFTQNLSKKTTNQCISSILSRVNEEEGHNDSSSRKRHRGRCMRCVLGDRESAMSLRSITESFIHCDDADTLIIEAAASVALVNVVLRSHSLTHRIICS